MKTLATIKVYSEGNAIRIKENGIEPGYLIPGGIFSPVGDTVQNASEDHGFITFKSIHPSFDSIKVPSSGIQNASGVAIGANMNAVMTALASLFFLADGSGASAINDLTDVTITSAANGQVLSYNGTAWVNAAASTGGVSVYYDAVQLSDSTTPITTGTGKNYYVFQYAVSNLAVYLESDAVTGSLTQVDINLVGTGSICSTVFSIDSGENTSRTATTAGALSTTTFSEGDRLSFDIDAGSGATNLRVILKITPA